MQTMSNYTTPLVTISLAEYNELLKHKETVEQKNYEAKEDVKPYTKAIGAIVNVLNREGDVRLLRMLADAPRTVDVEMLVSHLHGSTYDVKCRNKVIES
jgi:hypothetical protein